ncbi:MAG TPA: hybrid sensor histidine kinase/response regulator, partial [Micavibrio sp.]|nr:hybrid sensor histidine kinase/response regulator [Micavibrio sp.]
MMNDARILMVDDRESNLIALESVLQCFDAELVKADCGKAAIQQALQHKFALILMDVQMPQMDGYQCATLLRSLKRSKFTPIIFITAVNRGDANVFKGYQSGAVDFLYKPYDPTILKRKVGIFLDLYSQKQALEESNCAKELLNQQLQDANERLQEFVGIVCHDLRSPLCTICSTADLIKRRKLDEKMREELMTIISQTSERGLELVEELLALAALGTGKVTLTKARLDTQELIHQAVQESQPQAKAKELTIVKQCQPQLFIHADQNRLMQVLINFITNAVKFSPSGACIEVGCEPSGDMIKLWVKDSGIGIPPEMLPKLFDKSQPCSRLGTANERGTGFGLPLAQELVELHGSVINVASAENTGSCFYFLISGSDTYARSPSFLQRQPSTHPSGGGGARAGSSSHKP